MRTLVGIAAAVNVVVDGDTGAVESPVVAAAAVAAVVDGIALHLVALVHCVCFGGQLNEGGRRFADFLSIEHR